MPVEIAPEILRVNTDFDEGVLDASGHAVPDAEDPDLKADRDSYHDSSIKQNDVVTEDLHEGWFGVLPDILPEEWADGATITIDRLEETDPDTNQPETGEIRLHVTKDNGSSTDHWPVDIENAQGQPVNLAGLVYGAGATIPTDGVTYWIEGVKPGKITLEFKIVKGSLTVTHQQKFEVCTEQSKADWQEQVKEEILLETAGAIDITTYQLEAHTLLDVTKFKNFRSNIDNIQAVYDHYAKIYCVDEETFYWAGLAKLAGAPVYAGLSDAQYGRLGTIGPIPEGLLGTSLLYEIQDILIEANINIFNDLAWQFAAYRSSGLCALEYVNDQDQDVLEFAAWEKIDDGVVNDDQQKVLNGNQDLLFREQNRILADTYIDLDDLGFGTVDWLFSILAENPVPGGPDFDTVVPGGSISDFADRWNWITNSTQGMWKLWTETSKTQRKTWVEIDLRTRADDYKLTPLLPVWGL